MEKPKIRISYDEMEAYLLLPTPIEEDAYVFEDIMELLKSNNVKIADSYINFPEEYTKRVKEFVSE